MKTGWLLRHGDVLASLEVPDGLWERTRGLLGRSELEGAMLFTHTRSVHSFGMRFALDVAFLDADLTVLETVALDAWRFTRPRRHGRNVLEAPRGAFERWALAPGDVLEFRETR